MFGGLAFMVRGYMTVGVLGDSLMVKLGPEGAASALEKPGVRPMDFTGRPMKAMVFVDEGALRGRRLAQWVDRAVEFMQTQPRRG